MLSIIVSSYQSHYYDALDKNIAETCGVEYELIKIDNAGIMGTSSAYNLGGNLAKYQFLLFIHEDIKFETQNWGGILLNHFQLPNVGILGIAGGNYVPSAPFGWHTSAKYCFINVIQCEKDNTKTRVKTFTTPEKKVKALDGVFLAMKKETFALHRFDEKLTDYHGYDNEISLRIAKHHQNYVISDITLEHFSAGNPNQKWLEACIYIRKKLGSNFGLPTDMELEYKLYENFVHKYFQYYPKNIQNKFFVLLFFPIFKIKLIKYYRLLKFTLS